MNHDELNLMVSNFLVKYRREIDNSCGSDNLECRDRLFQNLTGIQEKFDDFFDLMKFYNEQTDAQ